MTLKKKSELKEDKKSPYYNNYYYFHFLAIQTQRYWLAKCYLDLFTCDGSCV